MLTKTSVPSSLVLEHRDFGHNAAHAARSIIFCIAEQPRYASPHFQRESAASAMKLLRAIEDTKDSLYDCFARR